MTAVDDEALAILMAAGAWAVDTGARLGFSRMSDCLRDEVDSLDISMLLPMLAPAGERDRTVHAAGGRSLERGIQNHRITPRPTAFRTPDRRAVAFSRESLCVALATLQRSM